MADGLAYVGNYLRNAFGFTPQGDNGESLVFDSDSGDFVPESWVNNPLDVQQMSGYTGMGAPTPVAGNVTSSSDGFLKNYGSALGAGVMGLGQFVSGLMNYNLGKKSIGLARDSFNMGRQVAENNGINNTQVTRNAQQSAAKLLAQQSGFTGKDLDTFNANANKGFVDWKSLYNGKSVFNNDTNNIG